MSNIELIKSISLAKYTVAVVAAIFISGCADTRVVTLEDSVEQVNNLKDYDSDGVIKARDKCERTVIGAYIDNNGCGMKTASNVPFEIDIRFDHNSYVIPSSGFGEIKKLAEFLEKDQDLNILIEGHTSKVGSEKLNKTLSDNRANAVVFVLVNDFNIDSERVSAIGYGFDRLQEEGDTEEAHAANRRIMGKLTHTEHIDTLKWTIYSVDEAN